MSIILTLDQSQQLYAYFYTREHSYELPDLPKLPKKIKRIFETIKKASCRGAICPALEIAFKKFVTSSLELDKATIERFQEDAYCLLAFTTEVKVKGK